MSRYTIQTNDLEVIVGWDNPMQTLYYQVYLTNGPGVPVMSAGDTFNELSTVATLIDSLASALLVEVPEAILTKLSNDVKNATQPTKLQMDMAEMFGQI
jgi:hypothetical protein